MTDHVRALLLKYLLPGVDVSTIRRFLVRPSTMHNFFFAFLGLPLTLQKLTSISFGLDDLSNPGDDLFGLMRPNFLLNIDLLMWEVIFMLSFREREFFVFRGELIERG